jgi:proline iminopeptidase
VRAFCDVLGIERPVVLGTSFGGYVALAYATRHPHHPSKLVLVSTSARRSPERGYAVYARRGGPAARDAARRMDEAPGPEALADFVRLCLPLYNTRPPDLDAMARVQWNHPLLFHFMAGERRRFDFLAELGRIRCPTLVLGGEDDPVTPIEDQEEIVAAIGPTARLERFPGCGHGLVRDDPERTLAAIRAFLLETE